MRTECRPLKEFTFEDLASHQRAGNISGWIYPKRDVSQTIGLMSRPQQMALNAWGWIAILILIAGVIVPLVTGNWLWALLIVLGFGLWRANRRSMEQFFLEQLVEDRQFFERIATTDMVSVVLKSDKSPMGAHE